MTTFKGYSDGVEITIEDPRFEGFRYVIDAWDENGRKATGNGENTLQDAIALTYWQALRG